MTNDTQHGDDDLELIGRDPRVDRELLSHILLGHWPEIRLASRALAGTPDFQGVLGLSKEDHRARVLGQLKLLVENGQVHRAYPKAFGGQDDHGGMLAAFEELVAADPSLQIKSGVQWGLFASAILHLGTAEHHERFLPDALSPVSYTHLTLPTICSV